MALLNVLVKGSYSKIQSIYIDEESKLIRAILSVYKDETQEEMITTIDYTFREHFDKYFSSEALSKKDNNVYKAIYDYIKKENKASGAKDAW